MRARIVIPLIIACSLSIYWAYRHRARVIDGAEHSQLDDTGTSNKLAARQPHLKGQAPSVFQTLSSSREELVSGDVKGRVEAARQQIENGPTNLSQASELLAAPDGKLRETAAGFLAQNGNEEAVSMLIRGIKEETDSQVRENLIEVLRNVSNPAAFSALARQAQDQSDLALHRVCRDLISKMDDPSVVAKVIALLEAGGDQQKTEPIIFALAHFSSESAIPHLVAGAVSTNDRISIASMQGLGNIATPRAIQGLLEIIKQDSEGKRYKIANVVATQAALDAKDGRLIETFLEVIATGSEPKTVTSAIDCLSAMHVAEARTALEGLLSKIDHPATRASVANALDRRTKLGL